PLIILMALVQELGWILELVPFKGEIYLLVLVRLAFQLVVTSVEERDFPLVLMCAGHLGASH
ncbi:hypothetical protein, partial [uncultured Gammaproteobacteria bacterium]